MLIDNEPATAGNCVRPVSARVAFQDHDKGYVGVPVLVFEQRAFIDGIRLGESPGHITGLGFDFLEHVARRLLNPGIDVLAAMNLRSELESSAINCVVASSHFCSL